MRRSITNNQASTPFADACCQLQKEWQRRKVPPEPISHALSRIEIEGIYLYSAEDGLLLGVVQDGKVSLVEDIENAA